VCLPLSQSSVDSGRVGCCDYHPDGLFRLFFLGRVFHCAYPPSPLEKLASTSDFCSHSHAVIELLPGSKQKKLSQQPFHISRTCCSKCSLLKHTNNFQHTIQIFSSLMINVSVVFFGIIAGGPTNLVCTNVTHPLAPRGCMMYWKMTQLLKLSRTMPQ